MSVRAKLLSAAIIAFAANGQACVADSLIAMSGSLSANTSPAGLDLGVLGDLHVSGGLSGLALLQDNPSLEDRHALADFDNALLFVQAGDRWLQLFAALGAYSLPSLGTPYLSASRSPGETYGHVPEAFAKAALFDGLTIEAGEMPSLIGEESVFTIENINIERGLLWNQTPSISRGAQLNYASGPLSLSVSWNDGFYSSRFNWISGSAAYTLDGDAGAITLTGGANLGHTGYASSATPLAQNNGAILNFAYGLVLGSWTFNPYIQVSEIPQNYAVGQSGDSHTSGAAILLIRKLNENWSVGGRSEYLASQGTTNLLFGTDSRAWSFTVTPTYQNGVMFARGEASYVTLSHAHADFELGRRAGSNSQARLMLETGILF